MQTRFTSSLWKLAWGLLIGLLAIPCEGQSPSTSNPNDAHAAVQPPAGEQVLRTFRDAWGREMEHVRITRAVPYQTYQRKELKETRAVQEWTYETRPTTQYQQVPLTQYQLQSRIVGRWNPFVQPQVVAEYVPVTQYQATPTTVNVPMAVPKYTTREFTVPVWELVTATRMETTEVIRPKGMGNPAMAASGNPSDPTRWNQQQVAAQNAFAQRTAPPAMQTNLANANTLPIVPISAPVYPTNPPYYQSVPLGSIAAKPLINPSQWFSGAQYQQPTWNGTQPLWNAPLLTASRANGTSHLRPSTLGGSGQSVLPQTAAVQGYGTMRDPMQSGIRPTELR